MTALEREKETSEIYGELVAKEIIDKWGELTRTDETILSMLQAAFIQGALWGLKRGEEITQSAIVSAFSEFVHKEISHDSSTNA